MYFESCSIKGTVEYLSSSTKSFNLFTFLRELLIIKMNMILAIAFLVFNGIGCLGLNLPLGIFFTCILQNSISKHTHFNCIIFILEKKVGTCYIRVKVVCSKPIEPFIQVMTGEIISDPVSIGGVGDYKCLQVPCMLDDGEVLGDVTIIGNGIVTKPDYLKSQTKVFTDVQQCEMADTYDFAVGCEEEKFGRYNYVSA